MIIHKAEQKIQEQIAAREQLVDTIGNLTLVTPSLNPSLGNESFVEKKEKLFQISSRIEQRNCGQRGME